LSGEGGLNEAIPRISGNNIFLALSYFKAESKPFFVVRAFGGKRINVDNNRILKLKIGTKIPSGGAWIYQASAENGDSSLTRNSNSKGHQEYVPASTPHTRHHFQSDDETCIR
jgi:hypothetical protein